MQRIANNIVFFAIYQLIASAAILYGSLSMNSREAKQNDDS